MISSFAVAILLIVLAVIFAAALLAPRLNSVPAPRFPMGWYVMALLLTVGVIAWGVALYPSLPAMIPVPAQGAAAHFAVKSIWSVFGLPLVGLGALIVTFALAAAFRIAVPGGGASSIPQGRGLDVRHAMTLLGQIAVLTAIQTAALAFLAWKVPAPGGLFTVVFVLSVVLLLALTVLAITRSRHDADKNESEHPPAADDVEREHWKYGLFYFNRDDPSFLVPKRYGIGWTVNFGQPRGAAFFFILLGVLVLAIVAGLLGNG